MFGKDEACLSENLEGDWMKPLSLSFEADKSDFFLLPCSSSSRLPIGALATLGGV